MEFVADRPIYLQIMDSIIQQIISNQLQPGEKVKAVREMAVELMTNPNTVQRALQELEREEILFSKRGLGRYVTEDQAKIQQLKQGIKEEVIASFLLEMEKLGWTAVEAERELHQYIEGESLDG